MTRVGKPLKIQTFEPLVVPWKKEPIPMEEPTKEPIKQPEPVHA